MRNFTVLWRWEEALRSRGYADMSSIGSRMNRVDRGDTLFILALRANELYVLGAIKVERVRKERNRQAVAEFGTYRAEGTNVSGPFTLAKLGSRKWRLRFESADSPKLDRTTTLALQLRAMRTLTAESATILLDILRVDRGRQAVRNTTNRELFEREGRIMQRSVSRRERDPMVRRAALARYGYICQICGLNFAEAYGPFAKQCVEVHHLDPVGGRSAAGTPTAIDDVVVCPNCHRAIHQFDNPREWQRFKDVCGL